MSLLDRDALRRMLRQRRRALSPEQQEAASQKLCDRLLATEWLQESHAIAFFIAADGEPDLSPLMRHPLMRDRQLYLPAVDLHAPERLIFRAWRDGDDLHRTPLGVLEPGPQAEPIELTLLDLVLTPLVGFDDNANRMGMGKGFYDRTFEFKRESPDIRPWMLGIAHDCQRVDQLETAWWDVPLNGIVTPDNVYGRRA